MEIEIRSLLIMLIDNFIVDEILKGQEVIIEISLGLYLCGVSFCIKITQNTRTGISFKT